MKINLLVYSVHHARVTLFKNVNKHKSKTRSAIDISSINTKNTAFIYRLRCSIDINFFPLLSLKTSVRAHWFLLCGTNKINVRNKLLYKNGSYT